MAANKSALMPLVDRLRAKSVETESGCVEWTGYRMPRGYGQIGLNYRKLLTHRAAWMVAYGAIPVGMEVCHHCDNPPCINVSHLFLGTHADNMADRNAKGRVRGLRHDRKGDDCPASKLRQVQVDEIRRRHVPGQRGPGRWVPVPTGCSTKELAREFGISRALVGMIVNHKIWAN